MCVTQSCGNETHRKCDVCRAASSLSHSYAWMPHQAQEIFEKTQVAGALFAMTSHF